MTDIPGDQMAGRFLGGPYGYLIKPTGLNEEHWYLADQPSEYPDEEASVALYALEPSPREPAADIQAMSRRMAGFIVKLYEDMSRVNTREQMVKDVAVCVNLFAASERRKQIERDAKIAEDRCIEDALGDEEEGYSMAAKMIAAAIRAQQEP